MNQPTLTHLGRYRILATLGQGRFATVYQAEDTVMHRHVAIRVFDPALLHDEVWLPRLYDKVQALARLQHPHILPIFDIGKESGQYYYVMPLAEEGSLAQAIAKHASQSISWSKTMNFLKPLCEALHYAHMQSMAHGDLKPSNILIAPSGLPLVADFGLTRLMAQTSAGLNRIEGGIIGTLAYIAPEVWETEPAEMPADIYALGCITYEMLTGKKLFDDGSVMQAMHSHAQGPQYPQTWPADVPSGFTDALNKALAWDPTTRYPNALAFYNALHGLSGHDGASTGDKLMAAAEQLRQKTESALNSGKLQVAKMAVNQWLAMEPDNPIAQKARDAIESQLAAPAPTPPPAPAPTTGDPSAAPAPPQAVAPAPAPPAQPAPAPATTPPPAPAPAPTAPPQPAPAAPVVFSFTTSDGQTGELVNSYTVAQFVSTLGQLDFYDATINGQPHALYWLPAGDATAERRAAIEALIAKGPPDASFQWPTHVAESADVEGFGYVVPAPAERFKSIEHLIKRWVEPTFHELTTTLLGLVNGFMNLHLRGQCFREITPRDVCFDPATGEVLLVYANNIVSDGDTAARPPDDLRFMAPEIARGERPPSVQTDLHTLATLLFYMLMVHHPLEGERATSFATIDAAAARELYGTHPVFIFDPNDASNRPVPGYHVSVLDYWPLYPQYLRDLFIQAFTTGLHDPYNGRVRESEWRQALIHLRDTIIYCPQCSAENFYDIEQLKAAGGDPGDCWACQSDLRLPPRLKLDDEVVMLNFNTYLYPHHVDPNRRYDFSQAIAQVTQHPTNPNIWGLKNLSGEKWVITTGDGNIKDVGPGRSATLVGGTTISFGQKEGEIRT